MAYLGFVALIFITFYPLQTHAPKYYKNHRSQKQTDDYLFLSEISLCTEMSVICIVVGLCSHFKICFRAVKKSLKDAKILSGILYLVSHR